MLFVQTITAKRSVVVQEDNVPGFPSRLVRAFLLGKDSKEQGHSNRLPKRIYKGNSLLQND